MALRRFNPFAGLPNPRAVWAWTMYDAAAQSFTLLVNTLLFSVYFKQVILRGTPSGSADSLWSIVVAGSMLVVVIGSPILGALADERGLKKFFLIAVGLVCSLCTIALGFTGPGDKWLAIALYAPANAAYAFSNVFISSFLTQLATKDNVGRISAMGWGLAYVSNFVLLPCTLLAMQFGGLAPAEHWGPLISGAGVWYLLLMIPTMLYLHEAAGPANRASLTKIAAASIGRLLQTARDAAHYRQLLVFLLAFFVYNLGVQVVVYFSSLIVTDYGLTGMRLVEYMLVITLFAGISAWITGKNQDRWGHRRTITIWLAVWIINTLAFIALPLIGGGSPTTASTATATAASSTPAAPAGAWLLWIAGCGVGLGLGGIGTASRAIVGAFTPRHKAAEFFGLWGMVFKLALLVGVGVFGPIRSAGGDIVAFTALASTFVIGLLILLTVDEHAGQQAARAAEAQAARNSPPAATGRNA